MLENRNIKEIKSEIARILDSQLSVSEEYFVWYQEVLEELKKRQRKNIGLVFDGCFTTAGIITLLAGLYLNPINSFQLEISFSNALSLVNNLGTIVSAGKTFYDIKKHITYNNITTPIMPFIGGHFADRNKISKYKEIIQKTKLIQ